MINYSDVKFCSGSMCPTDPLNYDPTSNPIIVALAYPGYFLGYFISIGFVTLYNILVVVSSGFSAGLNPVSQAVYGTSTPETLVKVVMAVTFIGLLGNGVAIGFILSGTCAVAIAMYWEPISTTAKKYLEEF